MSILTRARLVQQYSHIVSTRLRISEPILARQTLAPDGKLARQWADAAVEILLQDTRSDTADPLMFLSAAMLYPGGAHAMGLHMQTMLVAAQWLASEIDTICARQRITPDAVEAMPARGAVEAEIVTHVPRDAVARARGGVTLYVNNERATPADVAAAMAATNAAMLVKLVHGLHDLRNKGVAASAANSPDGPAEKK